MSLRYLAGLGLVGALVACAPTDGTDSVTRGATGGGSGGSAGSSAGGNGHWAGAGGNGEGLTSGYIPGGGAENTGGSGATDCATTTQTAEDVIEEVPVEVHTYEPIALFIMQDRSSSMVGVVGDPARWPQASAAIDAFANDPASAGLHVGLGFFPPMSGVSACDGSTCGVPAVPIAPLPDNASALTSAMQAATPPANWLNPNLTPTECALRGMITTCAAHMAQTGMTCVGILITDGDPTQCNLDFGALVQIAADGYNNQGVRTFVLGMDGANFSLLDPLAQAGGTDCIPNGPGYACNITGGGSAFIDALNAIRNSVVTTIIEERLQATTLECTWGIPDPDEGQTLDPNKVNIVFSADGVDAQPIGQVPSEGECANYQGGWYYDNQQSISVCPDTCNIIKAATRAHIDIQLGCVTRRSEPK
jgi:hypothetical protein